MIKENIRQKALDLGFDVCRFGIPVNKTAQLKAWLADGHHADMAWLAEKPDVRGYGKTLWPEMKSTVVLGMNYGTGNNPTLQLNNPNQPYISIYARGDDYHNIIKKRLKALGRWLAETYNCSLKVFVDTAPVMEKPLAQSAGIGWQGKHTCVVSRTFGSWLFLGVIFIDIEITQDVEEKDHCGKCTRCQQVCPTSAFVQPYVLDARKCISYLTIENKGPIPLEFRKAIGSRIYGCDDCLAACPWNKFAQKANSHYFNERENLKTADFATFAQFTDTTFRSFFSKSPIKRIGRDRFVRNVLIAIGNSTSRSLLPVVQQLKADPNPVVAESAVWAENELLRLPPTKIDII